ncbi:hypothetical protein VNO77_44389 [Canavalia gladiata]|uniref:WAT1-related protein n=1 Tax=Canavalia gladiata TaxID=3824 RepID=A0AAN9JY44_CANGL
MSWCVKNRGPVFTAAFNPLVQIIAAIIDIPVLHEQLHLGSLMGSILVMIGLYILLWGKSKEMLNREIKLVQEAEETKEQEPQTQIQQLVFRPCRVLAIIGTSESCQNLCKIQAYMATHYLMTHSKYPNNIMSFLLFQKFSKRLHLDAKLDHMAVTEMLMVVRANDSLKNKKGWIALRVAIINK